MPVTRSGRTTMAEEQDSVETSSNTGSSVSSMGILGPDLIFNEQQEAIFQELFYQHNPEAKDFARSKITQLLQSYRPDAHPDELIDNFMTVDPNTLMQDRQPDSNPTEENERKPSEIGAKSSSNSTPQYQFILQDSKRKSNYKHPIPQHYRFLGEPRENVEQFIAHIDLQQKLANLDDAEIAMVISTHFGKQALAWWFSIDTKLKTSWTSIKEALRKAFGTPTKRNTLLTSLFCNKQGPGQPISEFGYDVQNMGQLCGYNDQVQCDVFVMGLRDLDCRAYILDKDPKNAQEAIHWAKRYESNHRGGTSKDVPRSHDKPKKPFVQAITSQLKPEPTPTASEIDWMRRRIEEKDEAIHSLTHQLRISAITQTPNPNPSFNPPSRGSCHNCGQPGHWRKDCKAARAPGSSDRYCEHCDMKGHSKNDCSWFAKGLPCPFCRNCKRKGHETQRCRSYPN